VVDGRVGEPYDAVGWPVMSDDGAVVAAWCRRGEEQYCVVNGRRGPTFRHVGNPVVSASGSRIAYAADDAEGASVVVDEERGDRFRWVGNVVMSRDGRHVAYSAEDEEFRAFAVVDGVAGPRYDRISPPAFGPDGLVAYGARRGGAWFVVAGGREEPALGEVVSVFGHGKTMGYVLEAGVGRAVVVGAMRGKTYDWIGSPCFDLKGRGVYFAARDRTKVLVAGDREIELGEWVVWDPVVEGTQVAFGARIGPELWRKVVSLNGYDR